MNFDGIPTQTEFVEENSHDIEHLRRQSVGGALSTAVSQGLRFIISVGSQVILARLLEPAQFGLVAMVAPVLGFVTLFSSLGLLQSVVQRPTLTQSQLNSLFWANVFVSLALSVLAAATAPFVAALYHEPRTIPITIALSTSIALSGFSMLQIALMNRRLQFTLLAIIDVATSLLAVVVTVVLALNGFGAWSLVYGQLTTPVLSIILAWIFSSWRPSRPGFDPEIGAMLRTGVHVSGTNLAGYLSSSFDNVLVGAVRGKVELGYYDRAYRFVVQPLGQLQAPFGRVAVPLLAKLVDRPDLYRTSFIRISQAMLASATPGLFTVIIISKTIVLTVLGQKWAAIAPVIEWLCIGAIISPVNSTIFWLFQSQGRTKEQLQWGGGAMMLNVLTYIIGIHWGVVGVARTSALSVYLIQTPALLWAVTRSGPVTYRSIIHTISPFLIPLLISGSAIFFFSQIFKAQTILNVIFCFFISYFVFGVVLAIEPSGRKFLLEGWKLRTLLRKP